MESTNNKEAFYKIILARAEALEKAGQKIKTVEDYVMEKDYATAVRIIFSEGIQELLCQATDITKELLDYKRLVTHIKNSDATILYDYLKKICKAEGVEFSGVERDRYNWNDETRKNPNDLVIDIEFRIYLWVNGMTITDNASKRELIIEKLKSRNL